jgi:hypothetical protein
LSKLSSMGCPPFDCIIKLPIEKFYIWEEV